MLKLEQSMTDVQRDNARKRIERAKIELRDWIESLNDDDSFTHTLMKAYTDYEATGNGYLEIGRTVTGEIGYIGHSSCKHNALASSKGWLCSDYW